MADSGETLGSGDGYKISPRFTNEAFGGNPSYQQKILIFKDRVLGWQLDIADDLRENPEAGFVMLSILFPYFEMIMQFVLGKESDGQSNKFFALGLERVYPGRFSEAAKKIIYKRIRCGLFHAGLVKKGALISNAFPAAVDFERNLVKVNPRILAKDVREDFEKFVADLENESATDVRKSFETIFAVVGKGMN